MVADAHPPLSSAADGQHAAQSSPPDAPDSTVGSEHFRDGMSRLGAAVSIITSDGPLGRFGFTASAVCSVSDAPPTLLVCLNRQASVHAAVTGNGVLCVNVLGADQQALARLFGGKTPMTERFSAGQWSLARSGCPMLVGAAVNFDCRITTVTEIGTHDVLFCEVLAVTIPEAVSGLIYHHRTYHPIQP